MRVCLESNVSEILDQAGPKGMHVNDIAAKAGIEASKLGGCIQILEAYVLLTYLSPNNAIIGHSTLVPRNHSGCVREHASFRRYEHR